MERPHRPRLDRPGFTLVELLVAILIIGTLLAILLPTIAAAFRKAKEAQVAAEMSNLATALASFKNTYNDYPPSRVLLAESGYTPTLLADTTLITSLTNFIPPGDTNVTDMTVGQLAQRSRQYLQKFWPRCDFSGTNSLYFNDFNGTGGLPDKYYILSGSECLAFFLGGMPLFDYSGGANGGAGVVTGVNGFSKSPTNPFIAIDPFNLGTFYDSTYPRMNTISLSATNRTIPNYEFNNGRLIDQDGDHIPSYIDPFDITPGNRRGYAYFSAYGGAGYDPNDVNGYGHNNPDPTLNTNFEEEDNPVSAKTPGAVVYVERGFTVSFPPGQVVSPAPNPYTSGLPVTGSPAWINSNSFQLMCAGQDRLWGLGGTYKQASTGSDGNLPILPVASDPGNINQDDQTGVRQRENDNITNFSGGRLQ